MKNSFQIDHGCLLRWDGEDDVVLVPEGVNEIGSFAFRERNMKRVCIPSTVQVISDCAFYGCSKLEEVHFPRNLERIGVGAFMGCSALRRVELPEGLRKLEGFLFEGCRKLDCIHLPDTIEEIGVAVFKNCGALNISAPGVQAIPKCIADPESSIDCGAEPKKCCTEVQIPVIVGYCQAYVRGERERNEEYCVFIRSEAKRLLQRARVCSALAQVLAEEKQLSYAEAEELRVFYAREGEASVAAYLMNYEMQCKMTDDPFSDFVL